MLIRFRDKKLRTCVEGWKAVKALEQDIAGDKEADKRGIRDCG